MKVWPIVGICLFNIFLYVVAAMFGLRMLISDGSAGGPGAVANVLGVIMAAALMPVIFHKEDAARAGENHSRPAWLIFGGLMALSLAARLPGGQAWLNSVGARFLINSGHGLLLPFVFGFFFTCVDGNQRGFWFGVALALGPLTRLMVFPQTGPAPELAAITSEINFLYNLASLLCLALVLVLALAMAGKKARLTPPAPSRDPAAERRRLGEVARLILGGSLFFLVAGFLDNALFAIHSNFQGQRPTWPFYFLPLLYPGLGWLLDRYRAAAFDWTMRCCAALLILAPTLILLNDSPASYEILHGLASINTFAAFMCFSLGLAALARDGRFFGFAFCGIYAIRMLAVLGGFLFKQINELSPGLLVLGSTVAAMLFYLTVKGLRWGRGHETPEAAGPASSIAAEAAAVLAVPAASGLPISLSVDQEECQAVFNRHGLTKRENEVAMLILDGLSNKEIADSLKISENTVKTHISKIFNKLGLKSRKAFLLKKFL